VPLQRTLHPALRASEERGILLLVVGGREQRRGAPRVCAELSAGAIEM